MMNKKIIHIGIILLVIAANLFFGLPRLAQYTAGDETLWSYDRVPKFWRSIAKGNWRGTNLCDKPGITLVAISGLGLPFAPDPQKYEKLTRLPKTPAQFEAINRMYFFLRLPVYLFTLISMFFFYFLLKRLLSPEIALLATIFIGLSPILLGISLIVNTDAILWILMPLSLISFLIYQKEDNRKFLYLSGFLLGLALLDKFVANLLFPFFLLLVFVRYIFNNPPANEAKISQLKKFMREYLILTAIALATIFLLYPSAWIKPKEILNTTIYSLAMVKIWPLIVGMIAAVAIDIFALRASVSRKIGDFIADHKLAFMRITIFAVLGLIAFTLLNTYAGMKFYDFQEVLSDPKSGEFFENIFAAFFPLLFGLTPFVSLLFIATVALLAKIKKPEIAKDGTLMQALPLVLFIFVYYLANSISATGSTVRYQIVIYPIASIIAAIGLFEMMETRSLKKYFSGTRFYLAVILIFIISCVSLVQTRPFFLAYASKLLPKEFRTNLKDMGDGAWEISQYLNSLPNADKLNIWSDKKQVCEKFVGRCNSGSSQRFPDFEFDYLIASTGGIVQNIGNSSKIGSYSIDMRKFYEPDKYYDFKISINGRESDFIKVVDPTSIIAPKHP